MRLALAREYRPTAVSLDVFLPDMLGWTVLSQLKQDPAARHIPVQVVTLDEDRQHGLARGAFIVRQQADARPQDLERGADADQGLRQAATQAPARSSRTTRPSGTAIAELARATTTRSTCTAAPARKRLQAMRKRGARLHRVLDLQPPDMSGFELLERDPATTRSSPTCPVVVFTGQRAVARGRRPAPHDWRAASSSRASSRPSGLLDETALFLHRVRRGPAATEKQRMIERLHQLGRGPRSDKTVLRRRRRRAATSSR